MKHPGDRHATVEITRRAGDRLALVSDRVTFDGATGKVLQVWTGDTPAFLTYSVLIGLHYIWFDRAAIRWLYFFMGLSATAMIATGLVLWIIKREKCHATYRLGFHIAEGLSIGAVAGLPVAVAVFFWSNRLLPVDLPERALWEMWGFFIAWSACAVHGFARANTQRAWKEQLSVTGALCLLLPLLNMVTTDSHFLVTIPGRNWTLAAVDLTSATAGALLDWGAWRIGRQAREGTQSSMEPLINAERA